ncbi:hypothetical protein M9H77_03655 [Catharanthus roseus]|uniref:Uncharacterized protein n=1 Tax=Catharanthus roseus TaxID=4058 RepID=A0ACC0CC26_CATRO|nr:hypothetical protein M9H77_03655 [Catharanthus roseus]
MKGSFSRACRKRQRLQQQKQHPYTIMSSDSPGLFLSHVRLREENYKNGLRLFETDSMRKGNFVSLTALLTAGNQFQGMGRLKYYEFTHRYSATQCYQIIRYPKWWGVMAVEEAVVVNVAPMTTVVEDNNFNNFPWPVASSQAQQQNITMEDLIMAATM